MIVLNRVHLHDCVQDGWRKLLNQLRQSGEQVASYVHQVVPAFQAAIDRQAVGVDKPSDEEN